MVKRINNNICKISNEFLSLIKTYFPTVHKNTPQTRKYFLFVFGHTVAQNIL